MNGLDRRTVLFGVGGLGLAATVCPAVAQETPRSGGTLTVAFDDSAKTLDPTYSVQLSERRVLYLIYNTLIATDTDFSLRPELAKSWTVAADGKRYVFELQPGVKFHDGTAFDAEAVRFNLARRLDPTVASPQRNALLSVIDSMEVLGQLSIAVNLKAPHPGLLSDLADRAGFMVSPAAVAKYGQDFGRNPVGTGPFTLQNWTQGTSITLDRFPGSWQASQTYLDHIVFHSTPNFVIGLQRLTVGEVDFIDGLTPDTLRQLDGKAGIAVAKARIGRWFSLQWQVDKPPFDNPKLRQAVAYALDRDRINQIAMEGKGTISDGPVPAGLWWSTPDTIVYGHDPVKAKALLADSGVRPGTTLTLTTPSDPLSRRINQLVAEQLSVIGLQVTLQPVASSEFYARVVSRAINFTPENWTQRADPDGLLYILFDSKGFANTTGYNNPEVDRLLEAARQTLDMPTRTRLYGQVKDLIQHDLPYVSLFFSADYTAYNTKLKGFTSMPDSVPRFRSLWKAA